MCGGFTCSKNALIALNIIYILVSFILIGVAAYSRVASIVTNLAIVGGIIACGVFLFLLSLMGLIGAVRHHQVLLFFVILLFLLLNGTFVSMMAKMAKLHGSQELSEGWEGIHWAAIWRQMEVSCQDHLYMVILFLLFVIQFSIACACLAVNTEQQRQLAMQGWQRAKVNIKIHTQKFFRCYGFENQSLSPSDPMGAGVPCNEIAGCCDNNSTNRCPACWKNLRNAIDSGLKISGGIGLFFSFTEFVGVWLTVRYRNQRDPRANPSAFL